MCSKVINIETGEVMYVGPHSDCFRFIRVFMLNNPVYKVKSL